MNFKSHFLKRLDDFQSISTTLAGHKTVHKHIPSKALSPTLEKKITLSSRAALQELENRIKSPRRIEGILAGGDHPPLDFPALEVDFFPWSNFYGEHYGLVGCGPALLGQITHTNPFEIRALFKPIVKKYWPSTKFTGRAAAGTPPELMQLYLNLFDIHMIPYTRTDLCPKLGTMSKPITRRHVVLHEAHVAKNTMSWIAYFGGHSYHNISKDLTDELDAINFPPHNTFILYSPSWRFNYSGFLDFALEKDEEMLSPG